MRIFLETREVYLPNDATSQFTLNNATLEQVELVCGIDPLKLTLGASVLAVEHEWTVIRLSIDDTLKPTYTIVGISNEEYPNDDDA